MKREPILLQALQRVAKPVLTALIASAALALSGCSNVTPRQDRIAAQGETVKVSTTEVVFIHGMFVTPGSWGPWLPLFQNAGYTVSAPAWPLHDVPLERTRDAAHLQALGQLGLEQVLDHYRAILKAKPVKPILVGHSMGGLIAQKLLGEGLAQAAVAIDSAPPKGVFVLQWSFLKSNWGVINPLADVATPIALSQEEFAYAFTNAQSDALVRAAYASQVVPESRKLAKDALNESGVIETKKARGPLLMIAGEQDHIIPAALNYKNFELYRSTPSLTEFHLMNGRDHWLIAGAGWEEVAAETLQWIKVQKGR